MIEDKKLEHSKWNQYYLAGVEYFQCFAQDDFNLGHAVSTAINETREVKKK